MSPYQYRGIALTPKIIEKLIVELFPSQLVTRQEIISAVLKRHLEQGGEKPNSQIVASTKKALQNLTKLGMVTNPSVGYWKISGANVLEDNKENDTKIKEITIVEESELKEKPEFTFGQGPYSVYLYYFKTYKDLAEKEGDLVWPCKIGKTNVDPVSRIINQVGTGLPEIPKIGLLIYTIFPNEVEKCLHAILTIRGKKIDSSPGNEWFSTSPSEVYEIAKIIFYEPKEENND